MGLPDVTDADLGWTAGVIDGEGCIGIYTRGGQRTDEFRLVVRVENTDARMLLHLKKLWGGQYHPVTPSRSRDRLRERPCWSWTVWDRQAGGFLRVISEHLVIKREQAEIASEFVSLFKRGGARRTEDEKEQRMALAGQLKLLKRRPSPLVE